MNTTTLLVMFVAVVAVGHSLKCYENCGKQTVDGEVTNRPCNSTMEEDCAAGQICVSAKISFEEGAVKNEAELFFCTDKMTEDAYCKNKEETIGDGISMSKFKCEAKFCETALCNSGFCAHSQISLLVLAAGALVLGLF